MTFNDVSRVKHQRPGDSLSAISTNVYLCSDSGWTCAGFRKQSDGSKVYLSYVQLAWTLWHYLRKNSLKKLNS